MFLLPRSWCCRGAFMPATAGILLLTATGITQEPSSERMERSGAPMVYFHIEHLVYKDDGAELGSIEDLNALPARRDDWTRVRRFVLPALANQTAMAQIGEEVPVARGGQTIGSGRTALSVQLQNVGTLVQLQGRPDGEGFVVELTYECSRLVSSDGDVEPAWKSRIEHLTVRTTVRVSDRTPAVVELAGASSTTRREVLLIRVGRAASEHRANRTEPASRPRVEVHVEPAERDPTPAPVDPQPAVERDRYLRYARALIEKYDSNGDEQLSVDELKASSLGDRLADRFDTWDTDHDQRWSVEELAKALMRPR